MRFELFVALRYLKAKRRQAAVSVATVISILGVMAGVILDGTSVEEVGRQIFEEILAVAGGKTTKSELNGVGEEEFAPWSIGPTL